MQIDQEPLTHLCCELRYKKDIFNVHPWLYVIHKVMYINVVRPDLPVWIRPAYGTRIRTAMKEEIKQCR